MRCPEEQIYIVIRDTQTLSDTVTYCIRKTFTLHYINVIRLQEIVKPRKYKQGKRELRGDRHTPNSANQPLKGLRHDHDKRTRTLHANQPASQP